MSNCAWLRKQLRKNIVPGLSAPLSVKTSARDLGSHINLSARFVGTTLTKRMAEAADLARQLGGIAAPQE
eukprot:6993895-Alexandrium_andersonii.AAC.1